MKTKTLSFALTLVAFCLLGGNLFAQSNLKLRAAVPFDFEANGKTFAAGQYEITQLEPNYLVLRSLKNHSSALEPTVQRVTESKALGQNALVFHSIQGHYFLAQIATQSSSTAHQLSVSEHEKEMAKATPNSLPETVSVAANVGK